MCFNGNLCSHINGITLHIIIKVFFLDIYIFEECDTHIKEFEFFLNKYFYLAINISCEVQFINLS